MQSTQSTSSQEYSSNDSNQSEMGKKYQVVFVTAEVSPWSKTGGLAEVMGGLPKALAKQGHRVMTISPRWDQYADAWDTGVVATLTIAQMTTQVRFFHTYQDQVDRVFVDHPLFLERVWGCTGQKYYGPTWGQDWSDNQLVMTLFNHAALAAIDCVPLGGYPYGSNVTIVCNDWHTCILPHLISERKAASSEYSKTKTCLVIHNLVFQGRFADTGMAQSTLGFTREMIQLMEAHQTTSPGGEETSTRILNWLKGAFPKVDQLLTVSPTYGKEVETEEEKGTELCEYISQHQGLAKKGILGILNGVELKPTMLCTQDYSKCPQIKEQAKQKIQQCYNMPNEKETPLIAFIGRLDYQKGIDVVIETLTQKKFKCQFLFVGFGQPAFENSLKQLCQTNSNMACDIQCKGAEKDQVYTAADYVILPSRYEPCGLVQMEAMCYGAIPIVTPTGGYMDTVTQETGIFIPSSITAKSVIRQQDVDSLAQAIDSAINLYNNVSKYRTMQQSAMEKSKTFSWEASATQYAQVFTAIGSQEIQTCN